MRVLKIIGLLILLCLAYVGYLGWSVWSNSHVDQYHGADAIVILGAAQYNGRPSPVLEARLKHALYLYSQDIAPIITTTGGKAPGDNFTEAETEAAYLEQNGVPSDAILSEDTGIDTFQSMRNVRDIAAEHGIDTVIVVSDPLHSKRLKVMASVMGFDAVFTSPDSYLDLHRSRTTKLTEALHEMAALAYFQLYQRWTL